MNNLDLYKQQGLDLFKRFEIAIPQKKTEPVLQIGNELYVQGLHFSLDSKYFAILSNVNENLHLKVFEIPSAKCVFSYIYEGFKRSESYQLESGEILVQCENSKMLIISIPSGELVKAFEGNTWNDYFSSRKNRLCIKNGDSTFILLPPDSFMEIPVPKKGYPTILFSNNDKYCVIASKKEVCVWDIERNCELHCIPLEHTISDVLLSPDSKYLAVHSFISDGISRFGQLKVFMLETGELWWATSDYYSAAYFYMQPDGWILDTRKELFFIYPEENTIEEYHTINDFSEYSIIDQGEKRWMVVQKNYPSRKSTLMVFDLKEQRNIQGDIRIVFTREYNDYYYDGFKISPDKKLLVIVSRYKCIEVVDIETFETLFKIDYSSIITVYFTHDSRYILLLSNPKITVIDVQNGQIVNSTLPSISGVLFDPTTNQIAITNSEYNLQIRDVRNGEVLKNYSNGEFPNSSLILFCNHMIWQKGFNSPYKMVNTQTDEVEIVNIKEDYTGESIDKANVLNSKFFSTKQFIFDTNSRKAQFKAQTPSYTLSELHYFQDLSFVDFSISFNENELCVYRNEDCKLVKHLVDKINKTKKVTVHKNRLIVAKESCLLFYDLNTENPPVQVILPTSIKHCYDLDEVNDSTIIAQVKLIDDSFKCYFVNTQGYQIVDTNVKIVESPYSTVHLIDSDNLLMCYKSKAALINLKDFSVYKEFNISYAKARFIYDKKLINVTEQNSIEYISLQDNSEIKTGEVIAILYNIPDGYLWTVPPDNISRQGWFWTNKPEYIEVMRYINSKEDYELIPHDSPEWKAYIDLHNRQDLVMGRLYNLEQYSQNLNDLLSKKQLMQIQQFKHTLMLNS